MYTVWPAQTLASQRLGLKSASQLSQSPITAQQFFEWDNKLQKDEILVREIIDIDTNYMEYDNAEDDDKEKPSAVSNEKNKSVHDNDTTLDEDVDDPDAMDEENGSPDGNDDDMEEDDNGSYSSNYYNDPDWKM